MAIPTRQMLALDSQNAREHQREQNQGNANQQLGSR